MPRPATEKYNGISSDAVCSTTGKTWPQWFRILDAAGGKDLTHREIVAILAKRHGVGPWWQQMVTVGYEQARGKRVKHQTTSGFSISRSKTFTAEAVEVFAAWKDRRKRARWLRDPECTIRTATAPRSLRITWGDGRTSVEVGLFPKGTGKTQLAVQHSKLASAAEARRMKAYWGEQLESLRTLLEK
jgi:uncharacterized protein YndB with AHSA1/START domain